MFKQSCTHLKKLPKDKVKQWLSTFKTIICDADGVLWHFGKPIEGAVETFNMMRDTGRQMFVVTNNSGVLSSELLKMAHRLGLELQPHELLTSALSIAHYLQETKFNKKVYIIGEKGLGEELTNIDICVLPMGKDPLNQPMKEFTEALELDPDVGAVIVAKDDNFNAAKIIRACNYLIDPKVQFLATCLDAAYPIGNNRLIVGAAAMVAAVEVICARPPLILGKPNQHIVADPQRCGEAKPESTLMIGDTPATDIEFGTNCGFQTLFVTTGVTTLEDVQKLRESGDKNKLKQVPDTYLPSLADLQEYLC